MSAPYDEGCHCTTAFGLQGCPATAEPGSLLPLIRILWCAESSASALLSRPEAGPKLLEALERSRQPTQLQQVFQTALQGVTLPAKASLDDLRLTINVVRACTWPWVLRHLSIARQQMLQDFGAHVATSACWNLDVWVPRHLFCGKNVSRKWIGSMDMAHLISATRPHLHRAGDGSC